MILPTLADRSWYAYHCLPRDPLGEPPPQRDLEDEWHISRGTLSHMFHGRRAEFRHDTFVLIAQALQVSEAWLRGSTEVRGPTLTGMLPPRPGTKWIRHADVPGWKSAVELARLEPRQVVPPGGFLLGAKMPCWIPIDRVTPAIAIAAALYAYELSTPEEQMKHSTLEQQRDAAAGHSGKMRAAALKRPAVK
jgi:hypothetical protein